MSGPLAWRTSSSFLLFPSKFIIPCSIFDIVVPWFAPDSNGHPTIAKVKSSWACKSLAQSTPFRKPLEGALIHDSCFAPAPAPAREALAELGEVRPRWRTTRRQIPHIDRAREDPLWWGRHSCLPHRHDGAATRTQSGHTGMSAPQEGCFGHAGMVPFAAIHCRVEPFKVHPGPAEPAPF